MLRLLSSRSSFRDQLIMTFTVSIILLSISTSLITSWLIVQRLHGMAVNYIVHITEQFAARSTLAFVTGQDETTVKQVISHLIALPGVRQVTLFRPDYSTLLVEGNTHDWSLSEHFGRGQQTSTFVKEDRLYWHFVAPVYIGPLSSPLDDPLKSPDILGYVHLAWDKAPITGIRILIFTINFGISIAIAVVLIIQIRIRVNTLTKPLSDLVSVMLRSHEGNVRASIAGPEETQRIARVFNQLMEILEQHKASLESQVAIRTLELREARDAALTAVRHKSEFMAAITHEMRTPLTSVTGYAQLALEELQFWDGSIDTSTMSEYLNLVFASANDLLMRIDQILNFARIESGKVETHISPTNLKLVLKRITEIVRPLAECNSNVLNVTFEGTEVVAIDSEKLTQIVLNLLTNACKFTHCGSVSLSMLCQAHSLTIEVRDTGIGIPQDQLELIFEPFRQVDMSDARKYGGTGLGLAITKSFCNLLGGTITVESMINQGSCFQVVIPLPVRQWSAASLLSREPDADVA